MPSQCKYAQLLIQMYLKGLSSRELATQANMNYQTLRRKMRGDSPVTLEEALRFIDPETDADALAEAEYYGGFNGKEQAAQKLKEASRMVVDFIRRVSWHDAKTPPPVHDESWENAGEKHCCIMSEMVWVCCESRNTMKGWIENGKWYIEDGRPAADTPYGAVKFWAPLLEPPEVTK